MFRRQPLFCLGLTCSTLYSLLSKFTSAIFSPAGKKLQPGHFLQSVRVAGTFYCNIRGGGIYFTQVVR